MKELLLETYTLALPVFLGYIVWLLKNQKKDRDANSRGTMLLLRAGHTVTVLAQGKKLGKQLAGLEAAGFAGAAFAGKDEIKWFASRG